MIATRAFHQGTETLVTTAVVSATAWLSAQRGIPTSHFALALFPRAWIVALLLQSPSIRDDRVEAARRQLATHATPTAEALAQRMVGRLVCVRLR